MNDRINNKQKKWTIEQAIDRTNKWWIDFPKFCAKLVLHLFKLLFLSFQFLRDMANSIQIHINELRGSHFSIQNTFEWIYLGSSMTRVLTGQKSQGLYTGACARSSSRIMPKGLGFQWGRDDWAVCRDGEILARIAFGPNNTSVFSFKWRVVIQGELSAKYPESWDIPECKKIENEE